LTRGLVYPILRVRRKETMKNKETMREAGMSHVLTMGPGEHILRDEETGKMEIWFANKNHASYGIIYGNTHLEFARSIPVSE
jgi:hypothetical protein